MLSFRQLEILTVDRVFLLTLCAFTLFHGIAEVCLVFYRDRVFRDEEHYIVFSVLGISSNDDMVHAFIWGVKLVRMQLGLKRRVCSIKVVIFCYRQWTLKVLRHKLAGFSLPCHFFFSCINTVYSLFFQNAYGRGKYIDTAFCYY